jgi:hypothetical protein
MWTPIRTIGYLLLAVWANNQGHCYHFLSFKTVVITGKWNLIPLYSKCQEVASGANKNIPPTSRIDWGVLLRITYAGGYISGLLILHAPVTVVPITSEKRENAGKSLKIMLFVLIRHSF